MQNRIMVAIYSAMIFAAAFLSFIDLPPAGSPQTPFTRLLEAVSAQPFDLATWRGLPDLAQLFLASFPLALITCLVAVAGWAPRLLALITSALPVGLLIYVWFYARADVESLGIRLPTGPFTETMSSLAIMAGWGFWIWVSGAILLLLTTVFDGGADD